ncbi:unnamed protein product [Cyprideis torosa]|uniref:Very-long-chain (3R)-3-hydroxyacyl-CoA dehydratase n=1 Tax=Cyprideis torosa TaxID=163714 RepID=A0A7R8WBX1_9CRUS|nr:unnamed protein product [Cyprideis torosa]CAG0892777.1 unnamed protein product [Cyprideis torosa]
MGFGTAYLVLYNVAQTVGWSYVGVVAILTSLQSDWSKNLYPAVFLPLALFQTAAVLEVVHCAVGLVRSSPIVTAIQVASRVFVVWAFLWLIPESRWFISIIRSSFGFPLLLTAWTVTEVIRYSFYTGGLLGSTPYLLTWLRYTFFIILYPMGVTGELACLLVSMAQYRKRRYLTIDMPNPANVACDGAFLLGLVIVSYVFLFPKMYLHMFSQRRKVLKTD